MFPEEKHADDRNPLKNEWIQIQLTLQKQHILEDKFDLRFPYHLFTYDNPPIIPPESDTFPELKLVGGADISFRSNDSMEATVCIAILSFPELKLVHHVVQQIELEHPYIPGFLAFREAPALSKCLEYIKTTTPQFYPQILVIDGNGTLHPRFFGSACHIGVLCDIPTIGVGKNFLEIKEEELYMSDVKKKIRDELKTGGEFKALTGKSGRVYGAALRASSESINPVFVSPGHRVSYETSVRSKPLNMLLQDAKDFTAQKKYNEALEAYEYAIAKDPSQYTTFYKRAFLYINIGKISNAINDLTTVLKLKKDFDPALLQRGKLHAKECQLEPAVADLKKYLEKKKDDMEVLQMVEELQQLLPIKSHLYASPDSAACEIESLSRILNTCTMDVKLRLARAKCYEQEKDFEMAISDYRRATKINLSPELLHSLSFLHLKIGEPTECVTTLKECLKLDPEHKLCKKTFRRVKKLEKALKKLEENVQANKFATVLKSLGLGASAEKPADDILKEVTELESPKLQIKVLGAACKAFGELKKKEAMDYCSKVLALDGDNIDALLYRAEAKVEAEEYDEALRDFQKAHDLDQSNQRVIQGYQRAQRLQKQAGQRDYYKVLGVPRSASKKDIKKAYRKLAQEWHPDKYSGELSREAVVKKMSEINEAYSVLSDDELRQRFDNGDDPNEQNQGGFPGGGGFGGHQFFFQGGGGPHGFPFGQGGHGGPQFEFKFGG
ncbi:DnaJ sub C member 3 [Nowakowskiella sp. JEL0407]|nr:DnaJ sub C member 3 [Nowakowskiella sp. JEL0407]